MGAAAEPGRCDPDWIRWSWRALAALLGAPLATGLVLSAPALVGDPFGAGFPLMLLVAIVAAIPTATFGLPLHLAFTALGWRSPGPYIAAGALGPAVLALGADVLRGRLPADPDHWAFVAMLSGIGMFCASVGWFIAVGTAPRP